MNLTPRQVYQILHQDLRKGSKSRLWKNAEKFRREGMGWRYDGLDSWTTEAIFEQLRKLGADTSPEQFREQAIEASRCFNLENRWRKDMCLGDSPWEDFPLLASEELWRRLTPDLVCPELVASRMEENLDNAAPCGACDVTDRKQKDIDAVLFAMDYLERFPVTDRKAKFEEICDCTTYDLEGWFLDFVLAYGDTHPDEVTRVADVMSSFTEPDNYLGDLAMALACAGRNEKALQQVAANLERFPEDVWIRIKAGDSHDELGNEEEAISLYIEALKMVTNPYDWEGVSERLGPMLRKAGRRTDWDKLKTEYPKPQDPEIIPFSNERRTSTRGIQPADPSGPIGIITSGPNPKIVTLLGSPFASPGKVGRNDPCPCGSGRKYKKCCMGRD